MARLDWKKKPTKDAVITQNRSEPRPNRIKHISPKQYKIIQVMAENIRQSKPIPAKWFNLYRQRKNLVLKLANEERLSHT